MHINDKKKLSHQVIKNFIEIFVILYIFFITFILSVFSYKNKSNGIVILRFDALGDLFLWLSCTEGIRKKYNQNHITLICKEEYYEFLSSLNLYDTLIPVNLNKFFKNPKYHFMTLIKIRKNNYDVFLNPMYSRSLKSDFFAKLIIAKKKIGHIGDNSSIRKYTKLITNNWYSQLISVNTDEKQQQHEIQRNFNFLKHIGILEKPKVYKINNFPKSKFNFDFKYFVLIPGSSNRFRNWNINNFSEVVEFINKKYNLFPVICGGIDEINLSNMLEKLNKSVKYTSIVNDTSILDLVDVISKAEFVLTNETAASHISASVNTLCFTILGGGHFGRFAPYHDSLEQKDNKVIFKKLECFNCNWNCKIIKDDENIYPCISNIKPLDVINAISTQLKKNT